MFVFMRGHDLAPAARLEGIQRVTLSQKDAQFRPIPSALGGATGVVWYGARDTVLHFELRATGLQPRDRYLVEIQADDAIFTITSHAADERGALALDTVLTRFAEGACVGRNFDAPRSVVGEHNVKFWVKRDGNPPDGVSPRVAHGAPGAELPCRGNGDNDYTYLLLENEIARFEGVTTIDSGLRR